MSAPAPGARSSFLRRVLGAARLHADTYEEVEADRSSIVQATIVVAAAAAFGVASGWLRVATGQPLPEGALPLELHMVLLAIDPFATWLVSGAFAYMVGATFFKGPETETDYLEVLRTTGFAFGPAVGLLGVWLLPPALEPWALIGIRGWILVASVVAVRQALDFTTLRAIGTYGVAALLMWLVVWGLTVVPLPG